MDTREIGFVGVGNMGGPMAARLLKAGHAVHVFDANRDAIEALEKLGARGAASVAEVASVTDTVFTSLPTPQIVERVMLGEGGLIEGSTVKRIVDFSTSSVLAPQSASEMRAGEQEHQLH